MAGRVVLQGSLGSPASAVAGMLRQLVDAAAEAAKLAARAEAALLVNADAEASAGIKGWLESRWVAMYELDDALDDYNSSVARQQQRQPTEEARRSIRHWFRSSSSAVHEIETRRLKNTVEVLFKKVNDILQKGHKLDLQPINSTRQSWNSEFLGDLTPYHDIIGDVVQLQVMNLISILTDKRSTDQTSSHLVMIVGCRGTGKTTLARKVFDDPSTRNAFSLALWVRGSKDFTDMDLLSAIASASGIKAGEEGGSSREKTEQMLASMLEGKRILLVIDDVWSHQIHGSYLKTFLPVQHGSRIVMTTGDASVAEHLNSVHTHQVKELSLSDRWTLLCRSACLDEKQLDTSMKGIGKTLVQKYGKVPLAVKVIGGVLGTKGRKYEEWKKVISECEGWSSGDFPDGMKDVAGPIRMVYNDLPSHLKQCFLYCLHLPEDSTISKLNVTQLWISEGFIEEQEDCSPEDTAAEYYKELVLRNLLEPEMGSPDMERCRVHGCVRTVLRFLTKDLWAGENCRSSSSTTTQEMATVSCFRTVILYKNTLGDRVLGRVFKSIKHLRVLDLSNNRIRHIPGSLEPLFHLRFLNLSYTDITTLPESIGSLKNLQFLVLQWCYRFHSLPDGISKLHNLRTLDLEGTTPLLVLPGLAGLKQLTKLHGFIVNSKADSAEKDTSGWPLGDLIHLNSLRSLQIVKIDRIHKEYLNLQRPLLSRKSYLTQLELCGSKVEEVAKEEAKRLDDVLKSLQPPQCLESLKIVSFNGQLFPNWIQNLPNLRRLVIADCKFFEWPPALGQLPQLKTLEVSGCPKLRTIERGETGPTQAFPKLEQLQLDDMDSLKSWEGFEDGDLPSLVKVHLERCKRLRSLPFCLRQSKLLTSIRIISGDEIKAIDSFSNLKKLFVQDSKNLCISNLPALEDLTVVDCSGLQDVSGLGRHLKHLRIEDAELTSLPDWLGKHVSSPESLAVVGKEEKHVSSPETLAVVGKEELLRSLVPGGKYWPAISGIGKVYGYLLDGSPFFTYSKITNELEAFGNRKLDVSSVAVHRPKNWSPKIRKAVPSAVVLVAISLVPFLLPTRYMDFVPNTVYFFFLAYMVMLVAFIFVLRTL